jgi:hypothetical protein
MSTLTLKNSIIAALFAAQPTLTLGQHTQEIHEALVDDFYTPYPINLTEHSTFTGTIGELKQKNGGDLWDYYMFQSPNSGKINIVLDGFNKPVSLSLERSFPEGHRKPDILAESDNKGTGPHKITAELAPRTTYYIAVGTRTPGNGYTPYTLTVDFRDAEDDPIPAPSVRTGEYELALSDESCSNPELDSFSLKLPVYVVSGQDGQLSLQSEAGSNIDERIHEMFRFDPTYGMLVHEFSDVLLNEESEVTQRRDVVVVGNFEGGQFRGNLSKHEVVTSVPQKSGLTTRSCNSSVTAVGK